MPISKILSVFFDPLKRKDWVDRFAQQQDLEVISELDKIYWIHFKLPFFMSDRDYVLELKGEANDKLKVLVARIKSVLNSKKGLDDCDIVMMLRLQNERMHGSFLPSAREYYEYFGLTPDKLKMAKEDVIIMH